MKKYYPRVRYYSRRVYFPRLVTRYPRCEDVKLTSKAIQSATRKNGCVDLNKIRSIRDVLIAEKKNTAAKARAKIAVRRKALTVFEEEYKTFFNEEFKVTTTTKFASHYNKKGALVKKYMATDYKRMSVLYDFVLHRYKITFDDFRLYLRHVFTIAIKEYKAHTQRKIFGIVNSQIVAEKYFAKRRNKAIKSEEKKARENKIKKQALLFRKKKNVK